MHGRVSIGPVHLMGASIDKPGRRMRLWFNPDRDGEDVFLQMLDDGRVLLTWSAYGNDLRQVWLVGAGSSDPMAPWTFRFRSPMAHGSEPVSSLPT